MNLSRPPGLGGIRRSFLSVAAAEPRQALGQDGAYVAQVGWEVGIRGGADTLHSATIRNAAASGECGCVALQSYLSSKPDHPSQDMDVLRG